MLNAAECSKIKQKQKHQASTDPIDDFCCESQTEARASYWL